MKNTVLMLLVIGGIAQAQVPASSVGGRRPEEVSRRQADITKQLAELRLRSQHQIDKDTRLQLNRKLREISTRRGRTDVFPGLFRVADVQRVMSNAGQDEEGASLEGLRFFHRQLAERGIDLIVVPVVSQVVLHAHKLVPGKIQPGDDIWPAYTQILIELLEGGIEVIDLQRPFADHLAKNPNDDPLNLFDHHWASTGKRIGARLVAERLQRYAFIREAAAGKRRFSEVEVSGITVPTSYLSANYIEQDMVSSLNMPEAITQTEILYDGAPLNTTGSLRDRIDPLLLLGDSQVLFRPVRDNGKGQKAELVGGNFAEHLSRELGFPVPHRAENGGANFAPRRYAERYIREPQQPRLIVMAMVMDQLLRNWPVIRFPDPKGDAVAAAARFIATDEVTLGNWKGKYGAEGCFIMGDKPKLPPFLLLNGSPQVIPTINVPGSLVFKDEESDLHAYEVAFALPKDGPNIETRLLKASSDSGARSTTVWRNHITQKFGVDVFFQDDREHRVGLYVAPLTGRMAGWTTIEVQNAEAANRKPVAPARRIEYGDKGVYVIYHVRGRVRFLFKDGYPVLAGLFFDPVPGGPQTPTAPRSAVAGPRTTFKIDGVVEFASAIPDPKTSPYADALTTLVLQTAQPIPETGKKRVYVIGWAFKDRKLLETSRYGKGAKLQLTLAEWDQVLRDNPKLETVQRIDQTDFDPDMPTFLITESRVLP